MTDLVCTGYVCWHCLGQPAPGCPRCVDGIDLDHAEACEPCREHVAVLIGGAS